MKETDTSPGLTGDKILKAVLSDKLLMEPLMRDYVCDEGHADDFDYSTLEQLPTEHIDPDTCKYYYSDLVWRVSFRDKSRKPLYVVILLELQSTTYYPMVLRMLNYTVQFYMHWVRTHSAKDRYPLPHILPLVIYTGFKNWHGPQDIQDLLPKYALDAWKAVIPLQFGFMLLDVNRIKLRGKSGSLARHFVDLLRVHPEGEWRQKRLEISKLLNDLDHEEARDAWAQLCYYMEERNKEATEVSAKTKTQKTYPRITAHYLDDENDHYLETLEPNGDAIPYGLRMRREGEAKGKAEGRAQAVADFIAWRYAECPRDILDSIKSSRDLEFIDRVSQALLSSNSLNDFLQKAGLSNDDEQG